MAGIHQNRHEQVTKYIQIYPNLYPLVTKLSFLRCGGSLVNSWYVVTAGHCVARARPSQVRVTLGEYVLKSDVEPLPGRTYGASLIKVHPYFKFTPQADRYDVAVIR